MLILKPGDKIVHNNTPLQLVEFIEPADKKLVWLARKLQPYENDTHIHVIGNKDVISPYREAL